MTQKQNDKQSSSKPFPEKVNQTPAQNKSESQPDGTAAGSPRGETQAHGAQFNKGLADDTNSGVKSNTPERRTGINPSAPTNSTEGGTTSMPQNPTMDSAGEVGEPSGKGNMSMNDDTMNKDNNKDKNQQGNKTTQQNKQGGQQNMSGRSDRQEDNQGSEQKQGSGNQVSNRAGNQDYKQGEQSGSSQSGNFGQQSNTGNFGQG